jgi:RHS repeat-associated protein
MIGDGIHSYQYDAEGRLASVDSGSTASYVYDAGGTRVRRIVGGVAYDDVYDLGGHVISDFLASGGTWNRGEVYAGGMHLATYENGTTYFAHSDWLGTERVRSLPSGSIFTPSLWTSYPFGEGSATPNPSPAHFTGKERDSESGNDYFGARYYASSMGRWLSPDWAESPSNIPYAILSDPQSFNLYSYGLNNPLKNRDFDGHSCDPDYSTTDKNGNMVVHAGQCHLDWWDIPGHAWVGFGNIITGQTPKQVWTGVKQMFYAYSVALPFGQIGVSLGAADGLISLGLEADGAAGAAGEGAAVEAGAQSVDVTKGNSVKNWKTNASPDQVSKTLESNGFSKSTTADGRIQFTKGDTQCTMYPKASSTGGPSMQVKVGGEVVSKVRMK